jgi:hypothetical protein
MTWLAWRLQRTETLVAAGILALVAALLVPTGISMSNSYHHNGLGSCLTPNPGFACVQKIGAFQSHNQALNFVTNWFTLLPGVLGVLLAAPFILDLEHGTYRLVWTQSITRRRWVAVKLGLAVVAAVATSAVLIALITWWRTPLTDIGGRLDTGTYDTTGVVAIGYALFALGLAVALGAVWRRSAVSLTVAFVGYFAVRIIDDYWLRNQLASPLKATWRGVHNLPHGLENANILSQTITVNGRVVESGGSSGGVIGAHSQLAAPGSGQNAVFHAVYQPASYFWTLQIRETLLFTAVAGVFLLFAAVWTQRRVS